MKRLVQLVVACWLLAASGCITVEKTETRIRFNEGSTPTEVTIIYHDLSSDAEGSPALQKDFDELVDLWKGDGHPAERSEQGLTVKDRQLYVENGTLQARELLVLAGSGFWEGAEMMTSNGERIIVFEAAEEEVIECNGRILGTDRNHVLVWPEDVKEIYWIQSSPHDGGDRERIERNRAELIEMFETRVSLSK